MTLRIPKAWTTKASVKPAQEQVSARVDMAPEVVGNMLDPVTKEPMQIVQMYFLNGNGTRDLGHVAVNTKSRVVLPLSNEMLAKLNLKTVPEPQVPTYTTM